MLFGVLNKNCENRRSCVSAPNRSDVLDVGVRGEVLGGAHGPALRAPAHAGAAPEQRPRRAPRVPRARAVRARQGRHRLHAGDARATQYVHITNNLLFT